MADTEDTQQTQAVAEDSQEKTEEQTTAAEEQLPTEEAAAPDAQTAEGGEEAEAAPEEGQTQEEGNAEAEVAPETQEGGEQQQEAPEAEFEEATTEQADEQAAAEEQAADAEPEQEESSEQTAAEEQEAQEEQSGQEEAQDDQSEQQAQEEQSAAEVVEESGQTQDQAPAQLPEEDKARCLNYFSRKAVDGRLDLKGFKILFRLMGQTLTSAEAEASFQAGCKDGSGTMDFEEFCAVYAKNCEAEQQRKAAMAESFDKIFPGLEGDEVDLKKVERLLMKMQQPDLGMTLVREKSDLCATDIRSMLKTLDKDNRGKISKTDLVDQLCQHVEL